MLIFRTLLAILCSLCCVNSIYAQGAWNIDYIPIHSVDSTFLGEEIRIDFKNPTEQHLKDTVIMESNTIRFSLLSKLDTVSLFVSDRKILFRERWILYDDEGLVQSQFLESITGEKTKNSIYIKRFFLRKISEEALVVEAEIIENNHVIDNIEITLNKDIIKGILRYLE